MTVLMYNKRKTANQLSREKKVAKVIFWCLMPLFFAAFLRFYSAVFHLTFGAMLVVVFGDTSMEAVFIISLVASTGFSIATCSFLWKQYKKHILEGC